MGLQLKGGEDRSMISEGYLLNAVHTQQLDSSLVFVQYPVAPGWHPLLLARVKFLRLPIVFISGREGDLTLSEITEKLVLCVQ